MKREAIKRWIWEHMHESISGDDRSVKCEAGRTLQVLRDIRELYRIAEVL